MLTLVPCPEALLKTSITQARLSSDTAGSWVVTRDPALILNAGAQAISFSDDNVTVDLVTKAINARLGVMPGCTRVRYVDTYISSSQDGNFYSGGSSPIYELARTKLMRYTTPRGNSNGFVANNTMPSLNPVHVSIFVASDTTQVIDPSINELTLLMAATKEPNGVFVSDKVLRQLAMSNTKYDVRDDDSKRVRIVDKNFLIEKNPKGYRLVYSPKRVKRLIALRSKKATATTKDRPWQLHTCYSLLCRIFRAYHTEAQKIDALRWLYGYGRFPIQGIIAYMRIFPRYAELTARLGLTGKVRKRIRENVRLLTYHKSTLLARGLRTDNICSADYAAFMRWYNTETKFAGIPKGAEDRFKQLKAKLAISRSKFVAAKLVEEKAAIDKARSSNAANAGILLPGGST